MIHLLLLALLGVGFQIAVTILGSNAIAKYILPKLKTSKSKLHKAWILFLVLVASIAIGVSIAQFWKLLIFFAWSLK